MIPMMKRPQTTARVIFTKSFIFYFNLFAVLAKIKILCDNHLFIINFAKYPNLNSINYGTETVYT